MSNVQVKQIALPVTATVTPKVNVLLRAAQHIHTSQYISVA